MAGLPASQDGTTALLCDGGIKTNRELIRPDERPKDHPRTNIETPHVLESPSVVAATENTCHIRERGHVRAKAMSGEPTADGSLTPIHHGWRRRLDVLRIRQMGDRVKAGGRPVDHGCMGRLGDGLTRSGERG